MLDGLGSELTPASPSACHSCGAVPTSQKGAPVPQHSPSTRHPSVFVVGEVFRPKSWCLLSGSVYLKSPGKRWGPAEQGGARDSGRTVAAATVRVSPFSASGHPPCGELGTGGCSPRAPDKATGLHVAQGSQTHLPSLLGSGEPGGQRGGFPTLSGGEKAPRPPTGKRDPSGLSRRAGPSTENPRAVVTRQGPTPISLRFLETIWRNESKHPEGSAGKRGTEPSSSRPSPEQLPAWCLPRRGGGAGQGWRQTLYPLGTRPVIPGQGSEAWRVRPPLGDPRLAPALSVPSEGAQRCHLRVGVACGHSEPWA